jgi:hypothetical protein
MKPLVTLSALLALGPWATAVAGADPLKADDWRESLPFVEPDPWLEQEAVLPPYPSDADLLEVSIDDGGAGYRYYLDVKHLSRGIDNTMRYTVVIESRAGARNVLFEGLRCEAPEYKTYAIGSGESLRPVATASWEPIAGMRVHRFRAELRTHFFCDPRARALQPRQVVQRIKYSPQGAN